MNAKRRLPFGTVQQVVIGLFLAALLIVALESSSTYDEECGWGWPERIHYSDGYGRHKIRENHGRCRFEVDLLGPLELSTDFREVASIEPGAYLKIVQKMPGERRSIEVTATNGKPDYLYKVDGDEAPFDAAGRDWLARVTPRIYRSTGIDAGNRVATLLKAGGVDAVLDEMARIDGDHVQGIYLRESLTRLADDSAAVERLLEFARREISSDHALRKALADSFSTSLLDDAAVRDAFLAAARTIDSDHELRALLQGLAVERPLDTGRLDALLDAASTVGSDHEAASLLIAVVEALPGEERLPPSYADALATVGSDHEHARVLAAAFERPRLDAEEGELLLETATSISSDHILAELLAEVARLWDAPLPPAYYRALETVESDYAQRQAAGVVLERRPLDRGTAVRLLAATVGISADFEMSGFLVELLAACPAGEELPSGFEEALATVESSFEHKKVEEALERWHASAPAAVEEGEDGAPAPGETEAVETQAAQDG